MFATTDLEKLALFLVKAKISTYASGSDEYVVTSALAVSHQLEYLEGNMLYRDIYYGGMHFIGMETVFRNELPIWGMCYYGGVLPNSDEQHIAGMPPVLKAALRQIPLDAPYRGPRICQKDDYLYENIIDGDILSFHGTEIIGVQGQAIYRLRYSGGKVES